MVVNPPHETATHFPGMDPAEQLQFYFLRHPLRLWKSMGLAAFWFVLAGALLYISEAWEMDDLTMARATATVVCLIVVVSQIHFLTRFYTYYMRIVILTDRRLHQFKRTLLTVDRHEIIELGTLYDIDKQQRSIVQSMLGFGTLRLEAPAGQTRIHFTPRIDGVYGRVVELRAEARRRVGPQPGMPTNGQVQQGNPPPTSTIPIVSFSPEGLAEALAVIRGGGVIVHATETCYGLACDLANPAAVEKMFAIKRRPRNQPVSALFASVGEAKRYVEWTAAAAGLENHLPGPLTLIVPLQENAGLHPTPDGERTIGVRVSNHPHASALATGYGSPISTTSANVHGQPNPYSLENVLSQFENADPRPDLIIDGGILPSNPPSTVVDCTGETPQEVRIGAIRA